MMANYKLYPQAEADLEKIWRYTEKTWSIQQANFYIDKLVDVFGLLAETPELTRERTEFTPPVRIHSHAHHLVVYQQTHDGIEIIRILHESMDVTQQLNNR